MRAKVALACSTLASLAFLALPPVARAQPATPSPSPGVIGYVGKGNLVAQTSLSGLPLTLGGNIALEIRGQRLRLDILSLGFPGAAPGVSAVAGAQFVPPGGLTVVFDRSSGAFTVWSASKHLYYTGGGRGDGSPRPVETPAPTPPPVASPPARTDPDSGDLFGAFAPLAKLKTDKSFSASLTLVGHGTLFGHPVSNLHYAIVEVVQSGETASDVHGDIALADDVGEVPIELTGSVLFKGVPPSSVRLDLTELARAVPARSDFEPPPGYARAPRLGDVFSGPFPLGGGKLPF